MASVPSGAAVVAVTPCSRAGTLLGVGRVEAAPRDAADTAGAVLAGVRGLDLPGADIHAAGDAEQRRSGRGRTRPSRVGSLARRWGTNTHAAVDEHRGVLSFLLTPGEDCDSPQFIAVLEQIRIARPGPGRPRQRRTESSPTRPTPRERTRAWLRQHKIAATIPAPADQAGHRRRRVPPACDFSLRSRTVQGLIRCRVRLQPPRTPPRVRHPICKTRCPLRRDHPRRQHLPLLKRLS